MSERDGTPRGELPSQADRTLLGVPAPRVETSAESPLRSPVFVRSGTSIADVEPPPVPRMALPSRPPRSAEASVGSSSTPPGLPDTKGLTAWVVGIGKLRVQLLGAELALWMVLAPALLMAFALMASVVLLLGSSARQHPSVATAAAVTARAPAAPPAPGKVPLEAPKLAAALAGKSPESMSAKELVSLAESRSDEQRSAVKTLRAKLEAEPSAAQDKGIQGELFRFASDAETARDSLAAMSSAEAPLAADLLYEVWTGTSSRTDATELARALVYSTDVRPKASPALAVALDLRTAESCEQYKAILPKALKDGDRRSLHLLTKLSAKRGCGAKKNEDCFACLRDQTDELTATINAVKSRRPPTYPAP